MVRPRLGNIAKRALRPQSNPPRPLFRPHVSSGSIFELAGGSTSLSALALAVLGLPLCLFLFYAAIKKGMAETEEDDQEFLKGR